MTREEILHFERQTDIAKGLLGGGTWLASFIMSNLSTIEAVLRITSLLIGIAVGILTVRSILRKKG
ncbi:hypothetical protein [Prosthecobacter sp.]|uniref:hypothetical protein n=1 Tax=Prosthecobacter sp. TaxID=1965333 RepID=UPI0037834F93